VSRRILVVGGGGREHALLWRFAQDDPKAVLHVAPGNAGMRALAVVHDIPADDTPALLRLALEIRPDLVVAGPEAALAAGLADLMTPQGIVVFGPVMAAARLETSKLFAKEMMALAGVPTARHWRVEDEGSLLAAARAGARVVKADGLASGKGVVVAADEASTVAAGRELLAAYGAPLLAEERMDGVEVSVLALCDGTRAVMLPSAQDHKRVGDGDTGPNTGGMGTVSPGTHHHRLGMDEHTLLSRVREMVILPVLAAMRQRGTPFVGVLFAGLMVDPATANFSVLEFNARFGDPETQVIVRRLGGDLAGAMEACAQGNVTRVPLTVMDHAAVCVVMAAQGYPGKLRGGDVVEGLGAAAQVPGAVVFQAGTALKEGAVVTSGGRVLGVSASGLTVAHAADRAYSAAALIHWPGVVMRRDIGKNTP